MGLMPLNEALQILFGHTVQRRIKEHPRCVLYLG
jgi:hypothetical protein